MAPVPLGAEPPPPRVLSAALLALLGALTMLGPFSTDAFLPALPSIAGDLGETAAAVQFSLSGITIGMALGQLLVGPVSDALGRRRPLLAGSATMAAAGVVAACAGSLPMLVAACAVIGLGASCCVIVARAIVSDLAGSAALARAYSLIGLLSGLGPILGPLAGVLALLLAGWRGVFWMLAALGVAAAVVALAVVPESLPPERRAAGGPRALVGNIRRVLRTRGYYAGATVLWFGFGALFAYIAASPFLVQSVLGLSAVAYTAIFVTNGLGLTVTGTIAARASGRVSERRLLAAALALQSAGALLVLLTVLADAVSPWTLLPALFLIASSIGLFFGPATALALRELRDTAGTALAILGVGQFLTAGIVSPLVGLGGERDPLPFALVASVCAMLAWLGWAVFGTAARSTVAARR
ncbi:MAG: Bcr/CflA family efflux MFS transporter [Microbacteriaceae bacterium]